MQVTAGLLAQDKKDHTTAVKGYKEGIVLAATHPPYPWFNRSTLICRNASEILISIEMLYRLGRFIGIKYLHKLLGLSWGFGGGAHNKLEIKCWRPAKH
jgi:hypothetical protein